MIKKYFYKTINNKKEEDFKHYKVEEIQKILFKNGDLSYSDVYDILSDVLMYALIETKKKKIKKE